jgi:hypothetical protein
VIEDMSLSELEDRCRGPTGLKSGSLRSVLKRMKDFWEYVQYSTMGVLDGKMAGRRMSQENAGEGRAIASEGFRVQ